MYIYNDEQIIYLSTPDVKIYVEKDMIDIVSKSGVVSTKIEDVDFLTYKLSDKKSVPGVIVVNSTLHLAISLDTTANTLDYDFEIMNPTRILIKKNAFYSIFFFLKQHHSMHDAGESTLVNGWSVTDLQLVQLVYLTFELKSIT